MPLRKIAEGGARSLFGLDQYESRFGEGDQGELRIDMRWIPPGTVGFLDKALRLQRGLTLTGPVRAEGNTIIVRFQKRLPVLALIVAALTIVFVGSIILLVNGWSLFQAVFGVDPGDAPGAFGLGLVLLGGVALLAFTQERR